MTMLIKSNDEIEDVSVSFHKMSKEIPQSKKSFLTLKNILKFSIIPLVPLLILAVISNDPYLWIVNGVDHFYFEMVSVVLSFIVAYFCIMRGYVFKDKFSLFIGLGFHVGGMVDLLHGIFAILNFGDIVFESYFIPQTWVAGRIVMGIVLMIAVIKYKNWHDQKISGSMLRLIVPYTLGLAALATAVVGLSIIQPFPFVIIDFLIQRPYEMIGAMLFLTALIFFYKNGLHENTDNFFKGIVIAILIDVFANVIISYSSFVFDTAFNVAHTLKNVSLFIFVMALASSITQQYRIKNDLTEKLKKTLELEKELAVTKATLKNERLVAIGELASSLAHDLRNPLSIIKNEIGIMELRDSNPSEKTQKGRDVIHRSVQRMAHQLDSVMDFVRTKPLNVKNLSLNNLIQDQIKSLAIPSEIKINLPENDHKITCDSIQMGIVFTNIIYNAVQAMKNSGEINIKVFENLENTVIEFQDSGPGIPEMNLKKIFDALYTTKNTGTGLGLASCKTIIKQHGGKISVKNNPTTFTITIPKIITVQNN